jgi:hypothetical protein
LEASCRKVAVAVVVTATILSTLLGMVRNNVRFEVFMAVTMKNAIFWDI